MKPTTYDGSKYTDWKVLIKTERFKIAWCSYKDWIQWGAYKHTWFFSLRDRMGYCKTIDKFGKWYQLCIFGLNIGYIYKLS